MMRYLAVAAALILAGGARAQSYCNTSGTPATCDAGVDLFRCAASTQCHLLYASCAQDPLCSPVSNPPSNETATGCNTQGIAAGCEPSVPYSCGSPSARCYAQYANCTASPYCQATGAGGGGGTTTGGGTPGWGCASTPGWTPLWGLALLLPLLRGRRPQPVPRRASSQA